MVFGIWGQNRVARFEDICMGEGKERMACYMLPFGKVIPAPSEGPHSLMSRKVPSQAIVSVKGCITTPIASVFTAAAINPTHTKSLEAARTARPRSQGWEAAPMASPCFPRAHQAGLVDRWTRGV